MNGGDAMNIGEKILKEATDLGTGNEEWEENRRAFWRMHSELLAQGYEGKWVAIHQGRVVDSDKNADTLLKRVRERFGYVPVYIQQVPPESLPVYKLRKL